MSCYCQTVTSRWSERERPRSPFYEIPFFFLTIFISFQHKETTFAEEEFSVNQTDVFGFPAEFLQKKRWKTWMNWSKAERYLLLPCILEQWWKLVLIDNIIMIEIGFRSCSGNNDLDPVQEIMILKRNIYILCENSKSHRNVCALRQAEQI